MEKFRVANSLKKEVQEDTGIHYNLYGLLGKVSFVNFMFVNNGG